MKATGIIRRIDDLGRVVIPREIRMRLKIREGDPLEIFLDTDNNLILKKYSPMVELSMFVKEYTDGLSESLKHIVCISDRDKIISVSGCKRKANYIEKNISEKLAKKIFNRTTLIANKGDENFTQIFDDEHDVEYNHQLVTPILHEGELLGAIIVLSINNEISDTDISLTKFSAQIISKQLDM